MRCVLTAAGPSWGRLATPTSARLTVGGRLEPEKVLASQIDLDAGEMRRSLQVLVRDHPDSLGRSRLNNHERGSGVTVVVNVQLERMHDAPRGLQRCGELNVNILAAGESSHLSTVCAKVIGAPLHRPTRRG
jgi:hypothetical protein